MPRTLRKMHLVRRGSRGRGQQGESMSRSEILEQELQRFIALLADDPRCKRAILFGSLASKDVHEASDIDLIIIQETSAPFWRRMREMRRRLDPHVAADLLVYTPDEFEALCKERPFFRDQVQGKGRAVYERS